VLGGEVALALSDIDAEVIDVLGVVQGDLDDRRGGVDGWFPGGARARGARDRDGDDARRGLLDPAAGVGIAWARLS